MSPARKNRKSQTSSKPMKPGTYLRRYFAFHGEDVSDSLAKILNITPANARKLINANNPFKECHFKKIRKKCPEFDIESFIKANEEYEAWRAKEKPREITTETSLRIIVSMLRQLFLRSRERGRALSRSHRCCEKCGVSEKDGYRMEVHHKSGEIDWNSIAGIIKDELLVPPEELIVLCHNCHKMQHGKEKQE